MTFTYIMVSHESNWLSMLKSTMKLMALAILLAGVATGVKSNDAILILGCGGSIVFGFLLDVYHSLAKSEKEKALNKLNYMPITKLIIMYKFIVAVSFSYGVLSFWMAYYGEITLWLIFVLWIGSLMASVFTETLISITRVGFKGFWKTMLQKLLSNIDDKEEEKP